MQTWLPTADDLICAVLSGENPAWPWDLHQVAAANLLERASLHGVGPLLHIHLASCDWPIGVVQALRAQAIQQAMWELRHQQVLAQALAALDMVGIQPVLIKGTALAYSLYADPVLRTRGDTDLIIPVDAKDRVHAVLVSLGFERSLAVSGDFVSYQSSYTLQAADGSSHTLDLHWKINNSELLSRLFNYDELRRNAEPLPRLCPHARGALRVPALLLACMHRATHKRNPYYVDDKPHYNADRLIWLYDIHLLSSQLSAPEWEVFVRLATQKGLRAVCLEGLQQAHRRFRTVHAGAALAALAHPGVAEPAARYLNGSKLRQQWMDLCALGSLRHQMRLLGELFFPSTAYMRVKYPSPRLGWLPWLYLRRAALGIARRLVRGAAPARESAPCSRDIPHRIRRSGSRISHEKPSAAQASQN